VKRSGALVKVSPATAVQVSALDALTREIEETKRQAEHLEQVEASDIDALADKYSKSSSSFLAGVVGGCVGAAGGIALSTSAGVALVLSGPVGLAAGVALGILAFRGKTYWRLERSTQKAIGAMNMLLAQIRELPPDAPPQVRDALYRQYQELAERYGGIARETLDDRSR
jgi:hypothetical protein